MDSRLPSHLEISALVRAAQAAGGFATVLSSGEKDAGTLLILTMERGKNARLWERMPQLDGSRNFTVTREEDPENKQEFSDYVMRRGRQDPDCWILELEMDGAENAIAALQH